MEMVNKLKEVSLSYANGGRDIDQRTDELQDLSDVSDWCKDIGEKIVCATDTMMGIEVVQGMSFWDYIYSGKSDAASMLRELADKKWSLRNASEVDEVHIYCSLGQEEDAVCNMKEYALKRQEYLLNMESVHEYVGFMKSCFPNSVFAIGCEEEFRNIKNFPLYKKKITESLRILDEEATEIYERNRHNIANAYSELEAKIPNVTCGPDKNHRQYEIFCFEYETKEKEEVYKAEKSVECSPHLKLVRADSDLRIYFYWKDDEIMDGKKVLIGRVGRHPW